MNDTQEPGRVQRNKWTVEALEIVGFEEMPAPGIFAKQHNNSTKILVDMNEKQPVAIFMIAGKRVAEDDEHGTLLIINQIIVDAETGKMPTQSEPSDVVNVPKSGDTPPPEPAQDSAPTEKSLLELIQKYVGNDVLQVFGDTGAGKSKFCFEVAMQAIAAGKKVYYLDTERNLTVRRYWTR